MHGRGAQDHVQRALDVGMTDYVAKPYDRKKLVELIQQLTQQARERTAATGS